MRSPLAQENTPSFFLFYQQGEQGGRYFFKDFSSGRGGDCYLMVQVLYRYKNKALAIDHVFGAYQDYLNNTNRTWQPQNNNAILYKEGAEARYHVSDIELRRWNRDDKGYWTKYCITSALLEHHNVAAVKRVIMKKLTKDGVKQFNIERPLLYGYYNRNGEPVQVYQPGSKFKFLNLRGNHIHVVDQLTGADNILITKSLKDLIAFKVLGVQNYDVIAGMSETSVIPKDAYVTHVKARQKKCTLMDNDRAGKHAGNLYKEAYGIDPLPIDLPKKDLTDSIEAVGLDNMKSLIIPTL